MAPIFLPPEELRLLNFSMLPVRIGVAVKKIKCYSVSMESTSRQKKTWMSICFDWKGPNAETIENLALSLSFFLLRLKEGVDSPFGCRRAPFFGRRLKISCAGSNENGG